VWHIVSTQKMVLFSFPSLLSPLAIGHGESGYTLAFFSEPHRRHFSTRFFYRVHSCSVHSMLPVGAQEGRLNSDSMLKSILPNKGQYSAAQITRTAHLWYHQDFSHLHQRPRDTVSIRTQCSALFSLEHCKQHLF
jgi:hypothetical protein